LTVQQGQRINLERLKKAVIDASGPGKRFSRRGLSLAATGGKNPDVVRDLLTRGRDRNVSFDTVSGLANALGLPVSEFISGAPSEGSSGNELIEVVGAVQAGIWREHPEWSPEERYRIEVEQSPVEGAERFALEMIGHSMDKTIPPGSVLELLRVSLDLQPQDGDIVIVERRRSDLVETTCKRLIIHPDGTQELRAESTKPEFEKPVFIGRPDPLLHTDEETRIVAIVSGYRKSLFRQRG
jgi:SOS-response transcriptional repressor LexA